MSAHLATPSNDRGDLMFRATRDPRARVAETAKRPGRTGFDEMIKFLKRSSVRVLLVEKTDRLYRNLKDYVTIDELNLEIHFVKENVILSHDSRSSEKFMHGIKVLMAKITSTISLRK
jgi:DNA invertase Pin-like site-specific DNA recombinase